MASITERKHPGLPSTWQVMVRVAGAKPVTKTFALRPDAEDFGRELEKKIRAKNPLPKPKRAPVALEDELISDLIPDFLKDPETSVRHKSNAPTVIRNLRGARVGDINGRWVKGYIDRMRAKTTNRGTRFAYSSIAHHLAIVRLAIAWKAEMLDLEPPYFPPVEARFPGGWDVHRDRRLERHESARLFRRLRNMRSPSRAHWVALVRLALETGTRLQELLLAEWREFDLKIGLWTLPAAHTKSKKKRLIPLSAKAVALLKRLLSIRSPKSNLIFHPLPKKKNASGLFHRYVLSAGIEDFRFHDLRHEAITRMLVYQREASIHEIMSIVGHTTLEMLNRYANYRKEDLVRRWK